MSSQNSVNVEYVGYSNECFYTVPALPVDDWCERFVRVGVHVGWCSI